jgi:hypothetical protein
VCLHFLSRRIVELVISARRIVELVIKVDVEIVAVETLAEVFAVVVVAALVEVSPDVLSFRTSQRSEESALALAEC